MYATYFINIQEKGQIFNMNHLKNINTSVVFCSNIFINKIDIRKQWWLMLMDWIISKKFLDNKSQLLNDNEMILFHKYK